MLISHNPLIIWYMKIAMRLMLFNELKITRRTIEIRCRKTIFVSIYVDNNYDFSGSVDIRIKYLYILDITK